MQNNGQRDRVKPQSKSSKHANIICAIKLRYKIHYYATLAKNVHFTLD